MSKGTKSKKHQLSPQFQPQGTGIDIAEDEVPEIINSRVDVVDADCDDESVVVGCELGSTSSFLVNCVCGIIITWSSIADYPNRYF